MNAYRRRDPNHPKFDAKRDDPDYVAKRKKEPEDINSPDVEMGVFAAHHRRERELRLHGPDVRARAARQKKGKARHDD